MLHKIRVEALSERTENSATFVQPDGKLTTEIHAGPVRVKRGDAWVPVDLTLDQRADGSIAPRVHPRDLVIAGAGGTGDTVRDLASVRHGETEVAVQWKGALPKPKIDGRKVVYADVRPGRTWSSRSRGLGLSSSWWSRSGPRGR
ncbi:hypothetical protein ACQPW3_24880 [Actinosynnema sp. CA-248983]